MKTSLTTLVLLIAALSGSTQAPGHIYGFYKAETDEMSFYLMLDPGFVIEYNDERGYPLRYDTYWYSTEEAEIGNSISQVKQAGVEDVIIRRVEKNFWGSLKAHCLIKGKKEEVKLSKLDYNEMEGQAIIDDIIGIASSEFDMQSYYIDYDILAETYYEYMEGNYMDMGSQAVPKMQEFTESLEYRIIIEYIEEFFGHVESFNCLEYTFTDSLEMEYYIDAQFSKADTAVLLELYFKPSPDENDDESIYQFSGMNLQSYDYVPIKPIKQICDHFFERIETGRYNEIYQQAADTLKHINTEAEFTQILQELDEEGVLENLRYYNNSVEVIGNKLALIVYYFPIEDEDAPYLVLIYRKENGTYKLAGLSMEE